MRIVKKPICLSTDVYDICVNGVGSSDKRLGLNLIKDTVMIDSMRYDMYANDKKLFILQPLISLYSESNKIDIKELYTKQLVPSSKKGREIYDKIMSLAPLARCPFCSIGEVSTLDHYLPKSKFPVYSILPYNLVPCCKDCNTGKLANYAKIKEKQSLHPYYDDFTNEQWLFAEVLKTSPLSIKFSVNVPTDWDDVSKVRIEAHFIEYNLKHRFAVKASSELSKLNSEFFLFPLSSQLIKEHLKRKELINKHLHLNSWESAFYQALAESDWYCREGYKQGIV